MSTTNFRWGIAGAGSIAADFAKAIARVDDAELLAVGSRSTERAAAFAGRFDMPRSYGSYEELALDPDIDVVYVATLSAFHERDTLLFLEHGKHVLCEKPLALNLAQATRMTESAKRNGVFLMEAMWSRFLPAYRKLAELLNEGAIGQPLLVEADFGLQRTFDPKHRLYDLEVGGGALIDLGIYPIQLVLLVLGEPDSVAAVGHLGESHVDERVAAVLHHPDGSLGVVKAALNTSMRNTARIAGTNGSIEIPAFMHCPDSLTVVSVAGEKQRLDLPVGGDGLRYQVTEVHECLRAGRTESSTMSHADSLSIAATLDSIRNQIGLVYPGE